MGIDYDYGIVLLIIGLIIIFVSNYSFIAIIGLILIILGWFFALLNPNYKIEKQ